MTVLRIALIHATPLAISPVEEAFARKWPTAERVNLLDDALSTDRATGGLLGESTRGRILALGQYAETLGADGILFTCSAFGAAIEEVASTTPIPVLKPNEAMFEAALKIGAKIGLIATFAPSIKPLAEEFEAQAAFSGSTASLEHVLADGAMAALADGDTERHDQLIAEAAHRLEDVDVIMLAQFSMARAHPLVEAGAKCPVLTSPDSAVATMRRLIES